MHFRDVRAHSDNGVRCVKETRNKGGPGQGLVPSTSGHFQVQVVTPVRTPAYPPKAPIQGARKMAPEGGLPEILLPYIAFCFDPRVCPE